MDRASVWLSGTETVYHKDEFEKIVNIDEFDLRKDYKYQLVCNTCNSPVTFVRHKDGRKYFRHPKRTSKEITEKDNICAKRSDSISNRTIRTHNKIVEQTTLRDYTDNFKRIFSSLNKWSEDELQVSIESAKHISIISLFNDLKKLEQVTLSKVKDKNPVIIKKGYEINKLSTQEKYKFYYQEFKRVYEEKKEDKFPNMIASLDMLSKENLIINRLARLRYLFDTRSDEIVFSNEEYKKIYPIHHNQQLKNLPILMNMITHERSEDMLYWIVYCALICYFQTKHQEFTKLTNDHKELTLETRKLNIYFQLKYHIGCVLFFSSGKKEHLEKYIDHENLYNWSRKCFVNLLDQSPYHCITFMSEVVSEAISNQRVEKWLQAIKEVRTKEKEYQKTLSGYIYVAVNNDVYRDGKGFDDRTKIGKTKNIPKRQDNFKTYSSDGFLFMNVWHVKNYSKAEDSIHQALSKFNIKKDGGREWFSLSVDDAILKVNKLIEDHKEKYGYFPEDYYKNAGKGFG